MDTKATIARIWRGRTLAEVADEYEAYLREAGIPPLEKTALAVQLFRDDIGAETEFITTSYWPDFESMAAFTGGDPDKVHHLDRDPEFLIALPERVAITRILIDRKN
ncbi:hypothetical protein EDE05_11516 [Neorhizobium sp. R1-B]|jgi:hypothetical protein|uniref:hypothetical protein n=1 Tax=Neorhizobium TaxID=1525371 RepID=UPI000CFA2E7C|nr:MULTISPECIES: hypothetical protein [Neorhizobium]TCV65514.1 hypothetical protein EDE09_11817 [Neorhizobium sp. S3-V5DH]TDX77189.1 hypothetical protein EDE05_11516 [Neorhizobium sp. R1-B]